MQFYAPSDQPPKFCVEHCSKPGPTLKAEARAQEAKALIAEGYRRAVIAERLGISAASLRSLMKRHPPTGFRRAFDPDTSGG